MELNIALPNSQELIRQADSVNLPADFIISSNDEYANAADKLKLVKGLAKDWEDQRKALKAPILEAGKRIDDLFRPAKERLDAIETTIKRAVISYDAEQERLRKIEEDRLREIARKEREKLEAEARKAEEAARAKAEELARQAEAARLAGQQAQAAKLAAKAEAIIEKAADKADGLAMRAASIPIPMVEREKPSVTGLKLRTIWRARIIDVGLVPREYMIVDQSALDKIAQATKGEIKIPGVSFYGETVAASGRY